ncbi:MAG: hypothetical protein AABX08_04295 [Nanoarchaeota archaeon]
MKSEVNVRLDNSKHKRKLILESARSMALTLKDYRYLQEIKQLKKRKIQTLQRLMREIDEKIKQIDLKDIQGFRPKEQKEKVIEEEQEPILKEKYLVGDQISQDLAEIERKLNSL